MKLKFAVIGLSILILVVFLGLSVELIRISNLLDREANIFAIASDRVRVAKELESRLLTHNRNAFLYSLRKDPARLKSRLAQRVEIEGLLKEAEQYASTSEESEMLSKVKSQLSEYFIKRREIETSTSVPVTQYDQVSQNVDEAVALIDKFVELNRSQMSNILDDINEQSKKANRFAVLFLIIGGGILIGVFGAVVFGAVRPLINLAAVIKEYGMGRSDVRMESKGAKEIKTVAENFNLMADSLAERHKDQLRFISAIAHDLRNPLSSMAMASEILMNKSHERDKELSKIIFRQVKYLDRLVGDLLDTTRIDVGELDLHRSNQDICLLVKDAVNLYQSGSRLHSFRVEVSDEPIFCYCDGGRISQVLNNLVSNAIKYSPDGGFITVKVWKEDGQVAITVQDQGMGIDPSEINNIFKPFHRSKATIGTIPGIGLGLSTSRRIIESHGGELKVESSVGNGSTFRISLPSAIIGGQAGLPEGAQSA